MRVCHAWGYKFAQSDTTLKRCPPKAKVTRSNRVGCSSKINQLTNLQP